MRRNDEIELFSMSFLDLISCAMAGILVLYTVADQSATGAKPRKTTPGFVTLRFQDQKVGRLGFCVRLENGDRVYEGSSTRDSGRWVIKDDPLTALLRLDEPLQSGAKLIVYVEDFDFTVDPSKYKDDKEVVKVSAVVYSPKSPESGKPFTMELKKDGAFYDEKDL